MKSTAEHVANVLAVAIWADGEYDETERTAVREIAESMGYSTMIFEKMIEGGVGGMLKSDEVSVNNILQKSAKAIVDSEKGQVYEAAIEIVLSNSVIAYDEIDRLLAVAGALDINMEDAVELIVDMVNPDVDAEDDIIATIEATAGDFDKLVEGVIDLCEKVHDPETFAIER